MTGPATPSNQEGPTQSPPHLPEGWLAQWEGQSKKYYYVQRATGISTWEVPTQPAPSVPTPGPTPQQAGDPFPQPAGSAQYGDSTDGSTKPQDSPGNYQGAERSFLTDMAVNAATGGKHNKTQKQSGLGGLASSLLGGQGSHGSGGHSGGSGGIAGQLVGSLLGGGKPQHSGAGGGHGGSSSGASHQGGLMGMASSFLGGHQSSSAPNSNYGYSSSGHASGSAGYVAQAPPAAYQPPNQQGSAQYGVSSGQYNPQNTSNQTSNYSAQSTYGQGGQGSAVPPHGQSSQGYPATQGGYGHPNPSLSSPPPTQYGGSGSSTPAYGHQNPPYNPQAPSQGYSAYQGQGQQQHYPPPPPPPPQSTPSYQGQPGGYDSYGSQHSSTPGQYPPAPSPGYPGPPNYGGQGGPNYGQHPPPPSHQQSGYGQQGSYGGSGAPPAPGWRA